MKIDLNDTEKTLVSRAIAKYAAGATDDLVKELCDQVSGKLTGTAPVATRKPRSKKES